MRVLIQLTALIATLLLEACGGSATPDPTVGGSAAPAASSPLSRPAIEGSPSAPNPSPSRPAIEGLRSGSESNPSRPAPEGSSIPSRELTNPTATTVVLLYYELAHLPLPIETWVDDDPRVKFAPAPEKAPHRDIVRAELQSAAASVRDIGALRLTMNANLSDYDPTYGEFTVRALSPSSVVNFDALGQKVAVSFSNGRTAQIWRVPQAEAQAIRDKIGYASNVEIDVLLRIANVLPGPGGGTLSTEVLEYELRETQRGSALARVQLAHR